MEIWLKSALGTLKDNHFLYFFSHLARMDAPSNEDTIFFWHRENTEYMQCFAQYVHISPTD